MTKYVEATDILTWVNIQLHGKAVVGDIPEIFIDMAEVKVDSEMVNRRLKLIPTENDDNNFLKFAAFCFTLELLCKARYITQTNGDVLADSFGEVAHNYQRANPLFFFAQGTSQSFMDLLPYETFRMYGYSFLRAYMAYNFYERTGRTIAKPLMDWDKTSGGYGFNVEDEVYELADLESEADGLDDSEVTEQ